MGLRASFDYIAGRHCLKSLCALGFLGLGRVDAGLLDKPFLGRISDRRCPPSASGSRGTLRFARATLTQENRDVIAPASLSEVAATPGGRFAGQPPRAPGSLEVIAADQAVQVEDLAGEVKAGDQPAFHGLRVDFLERDAAAGYLGFFESERSGDR